MSIAPPRKRYLWVWLVIVALFYAIWGWLVFGQGRWPEVRAHWPIALAMTFGSYVAGSTPMGGGTVAFPILVLLFGLPAQLGRDFSFASQAVGMVSAAIFIFVRRQTVALSMLKGAMAGALVGVPVGVLFIAPHVPSIVIKVVFAVVWGSFGLLHLYRINEISAHEGMTEFDERWDFRVGLALGFFAGATVVSVTGVGLEMMMYATLVLLCRADLKIAIPTAVTSMGFASLVGAIVKIIFGGLQPGVYPNWLAAAPIVILGAPLGVVVVNLLGRRSTLRVVAVLCVGQFIWMCATERHVLGVAGIVLAVVALGLCLLGLEKLRAWGAVLVGEVQARNRARAAERSSLGQLMEEETR